MSAIPKKSKGNIDLLSDADLDSSQKSEEPKAERRPICVFALEASAPFKKIEKDFHEFGLQAVFVKSEQELKEAQLAPENFLNFVNVKAFPGALKLFALRPSEQKSFWIAVTPRLTNNQTHALYNMGIADTLSVPVHPVTYKSRARLFLTRYLRHNEMPEDIILPPGISRPKAISRDSSGYAGTGQEDHIHRIHDLSANEEEGNGWNIHSSNKQQEKPIRSPWFTACSDPSKSPIITGTFGSQQVPQIRLDFHKSASEHLIQQPVLFKPVKNDKNTFLREAAKKRSESLIWQPRQWIHNSNIVNWSQETNSIGLAYPPELNQTEFEQFLAHSGPPTVYFSVYLNRARLFFIQDLSKIRFRGDLFEIEIPQEFYIVQRREFYRLPLGPNSSFKVKITLENNSTIEVCPDNISATGTRITIDATEGEHIKVHQHCKRIEFEIYGRTIACQGKIQWKNALKNSSKVSCGIRFLAMEAEEQDGINLYVMEESYNYMRQYVMPDDDTNS